METGARCEAWTPGRTHPRSAMESAMRARKQQQPKAHFPLGVRFSLLTKPEIEMNDARDKSDPVLLYHKESDSILKGILPQDAVVGNFVVRYWEGKPGKPERIKSIFARGRSVKGHGYVCGYSDHFGDAPKSSMSFSSSEEEAGKPFRTLIYAQVVGDNRQVVPVLFQAQHNQWG